jgi:hypothetical protein
MRFANAGVGGLILAEDDFELEEMAEILDDVQVNPGSAGNKQSAMLPKPPHHTIGERESLAQ